MKKIRNAFCSKKLLNGRFWLGTIGLLFCIIVISTSNFEDLGLAPHFLVQRARVLSVETGQLVPDHYVANLYLGGQLIEIEILTGEHAGRRFYIENFLRRFFNLPVRENTEILVSVTPGIEYLEEHHVTVFGPSRGLFLHVFVGLFILALVAVGRMKGFYAAVSLVFTCITVLFFMISFIVQGYNPVVFALITAILTSAFSIFMIADISLKSIAAIGGTWAGLIAAGLISLGAGRLAHVSGMHLPYAEQIIFHSPPNTFIQIPQLFFAGIIIAALGAVMDVSMSIASVVFEIKSESPKIQAKNLYKSGMRIGGDIMGTMSNTLILAFVGSSISTIVLIVLFGFPYLRVINLDLVAIEIIQGISASIGLILALPVTSFFSAVLATDNKISKFLKIFIDK